MVKQLLINQAKVREVFTPNIRIKGEKGINSQATIVHKSDSQAITQSLSNLAMMAMVQSVFNKLDVLEGKIEDIKKGQKNDRIGNIIGAFKGFIDLYSAFKTEADLKYAASDAYIHMQIGLSQIHQQLNEEVKSLTELLLMTGKLLSYLSSPLIFSEMHQNNLQNIIQIISMTFNYITGSFC